MLEKYFNNSNYDSLSITALLLIIDEMQWDNITVQEC